MKIFKQLIYTGIFATLIMATISCVKDKSNDGIKAINTTSVNDSAALQTITVQMSDSLVLKPTLTQSQNKDTAAYDYSWVAYDNSSSAGYDAVKTTIATSKALQYHVTGTPFTVGHQYRLIYSVKDKSTGISSYLYYELNIVGSYSKGWLFLEDNNGNTDLTMMVADTLVYHHLYSGISSYLALGTPRKISITNYTVSDGLADDGKRLYLIGSNNLVQLSYSSMEVQLKANDLFFNAPALDPQNLQWQFYLYYGTLYNGDGIIFNAGKVYYNLQGGFPGDKKWGGMLLSATDGNNYSMYPYMASTNDYYAPLQMAAYDNTNKKFLQISSSGLDEVPASLSTSGAFSMNNVGLTMVNMDTSNVINQWSCLMKDGSNNAYYLRFSTAPSITTSSLVKQQIPDNSILNATTWASSTLTPHIFYNAGNTLWKYETTSNTVQQLYALPANETITKIYFDKTVIRVNAATLVVATYNGTAGKVYYFDVDGLGNITAPAKTFTGFNKIVDIAYKY